MAEQAREAQPEVEQQYAHAIHTIERNCGILVTEDFLLLKFWNLLDFCEICEQEKQERESESR